MRLQMMSFCFTVEPDVLLYRGQERKRSMLMVSPALCPGQLSYAVALRGSNLDDLSSSFLTCGLGHRQTEHTEAYVLLMVDI